MPSKPIPVVKEGQLWQDNDPRFPGRLLEVKYVEPLKYVIFTVRKTGKQTKIAWHRIEQSTARRGYSLVAEPAPAAPPSLAPLPPATPAV